MSADEVFESLGVRYYRIECAAAIMGMKQIGTVVCDVVYYDGIFYLSMKRKFWEGNTSPRLYYILCEYERNNPQWHNNHRKDIEKKILMFLSRPPKSEDETGGNGRRKMLTPAGMEEEAQHRFNPAYIDEDGNEEPVPGYMHGDSLPIENHRADSSDEGSIEEDRLECLTEKQREAWKLKQKGLTYNEIAARLNISYVGARNHVIHAEQKLQKYDSRAEMEKGRGESAGVLWTAKPPEQEIGAMGNTNYPVEQPLSRTDALLMLNLIGDYIKTCEYVTPHNAKKSGFHECRICTDMQ
ncbi:MAG: hypothetical protein LUC90_10240 [Lachnospiraceae bacterium]|nr:hypothetical protein [Lachnospiraceae bacterium]